MISPGGTGFIAIEPKLTDFIAGGETGIKALPIQSIGDWLDYAPTPEWQRLMTAVFTNGGAIDFLDCVTFGALQELESYLNYQIKTNNLVTITADDVAWLHTNGYVDDTGNVCFSKRFTAQMSGTTQAGNNFPAVWNSARHDGLIPDAMWPMPVAALEQIAAANPANYQEAWNLYYATPPAVAVNLGRQFAARFNIQYEWLSYLGAQLTTAQLEGALLISPIQIATAVCPPWNTSSPIAGCGPGAAHSTLLLNIEQDGNFDIFDHYSPFDKTLEANYDIPYAMRGVISSQEAQNAPSAPFTYVFTKDLSYEGASNDPVELEALQQALQYLTSPLTQLPYLHPGVFGPYGPQTRAAVAAYQSDHGIVDPEPGADFGPKTIASINAALVSGT